jgi:gamma-glutamylcyclotransferase (GGCT)/AIG2-like uncharacterized protein YtfP
MLRVFVYGTLKPGYANFQRYCAPHCPTLQSGYTFGKLYHLPRCGYPALISGRDRVWGYLLSFAEDEVLRDLDALEDYQPDRAPEQNEYERQRVPVYDPLQRSLGLAWGYLMRYQRVQAHGGEYLPGGCWGESSH